MKINVLGKVFVKFMSLKLAQIHYGLDELKHFLSIYVSKISSQKIIIYIEAVSGHKATRCYDPL